MSAIQYKNENNTHVADFELSNGNTCHLVIDKIPGNVRRITITTTTAAGRQSETINYSNSLAKAKRLVNGAFAPILKQQK